MQLHQCTLGCVPALQGRLAPTQHKSHEKTHGLVSCLPSARRLVSTTVSCTANCSTATGHTLALHLDAHYVPNQPGLTSQTNKCAPDTHMQGSLPPIVHATPYVQVGTHTCTPLMRPLSVLSCQTVRDTLDLTPNDQHISAHTCCTTNTAVQCVPS